MSRVVSPDWETAHIGFFEPRHIFRMDRMLIAVTLVLAAIGLMNLFSTDQPLESDSVSRTSHMLLQLRNFGVGMLFCLIILSFDYRFLVSLAPLGYLVALILLIAVEVQGMVIKGSTRWLDLGFMSIQPSELSKLAIIFMLAWYLSWAKERIRQPHWFALTFIIAGVPGILILIEPDLGTAVALGPITFAMLFAAGCRIWHMAALIACGLIGISAIVLNVNGVIELPDSAPQLEEHQKQRIRSFLNPEEDPDASWHATQARLAIGSGEMMGRGFRRGIQTHLKYVPEYRTDSIFVVLAEENGFVGSVVVIGLFGILFMRGLQLARDCSEMSGMLLGVGCVTLLFFHVFTNIAITLGLLPVTGLPLPFLSYGGTFYLTVMMTIGVLMSIGIKRAAHGAGKA